MTSMICWRGRTAYHSSGRAHRARSTCSPRTSMSAMTQPSTAWAASSAGVAEAGALLARPAALTGPGGRGRLVEGGVALDAGDDVGAGQIAAGQAGVGAVAAEDERVVGQPAGHLLLDHLLAQVEQRAAVALAVAAHVDGQADRL